MKASVVSNCRAQLICASEIIMRVCDCYAWARVILTCTIYMHARDCSAHARWLYVCANNLLVRDCYARARLLCLCAIDLRLRFRDLLQYFPLCMHIAQVATKSRTRLFGKINRVRSHLSPGNGNSNQVKRMFQKIAVHFVRAKNWKQKWRAKTN